MSSPPHLPSTTRLLAWSKVEQSAAAIFDIWVDQPELRWAREAWQVLSQQGLAAYSNELELCAVKIRLLTLAAFYCDFCYMAWQEPATPTLLDWASHTGIDPSDARRLTPGDDENAQNDRSSYERDLEAVTKLVRRERPAVVQALFRGYGGINELLVALSNSNKDKLPVNYDPESDCGVYEDSAGQVLNDPNSELLSAYAWLDQGAEEILSE